MRFMLLPNQFLEKLRAAGHRLPSSDELRFQQFLVDDPGLYAALWSSFDELAGQLVAEDCAARLPTLLVRLFGSFESAAPSGKTTCHASDVGLRRVAAYLRGHVAENISLDDLGTLAELSKFYLLRAFRRAYGLTPHAYQMQLRLARAWQLIADRTRLSWVAYEAGFADQSHLTRRFATQFGVTPGQLVRQLTRPIPQGRQAVQQHAVIASTAA
jgi:AraC-like DNA-binding protein